MFDSLYKDMQYQWRTGGFWVRYISICVLVFIMVNVLKAWFTFQDGQVAGVSYRQLVDLFCLSSNPLDNLKYFWVWLSHLFVHEGFFHLLWNMLWLYWISAIVEDLIGRRHALYIFFESALAGGLFFLLSTVLFPWYRGIEVHAQGSSAAINGLLFAAATLSPNYNIRLFLIGNVSLKYLAAGLLVLDLLFAGQNANTGGHFAHVGGALWGWAYVVLLRKGYVMDFLKSRERSKKVQVGNVRPMKQPERKDLNQLDRILDKIKHQGIQSLTKEEKDFLDRASKE